MVPNMDENITKAIAAAITKLLRPLVMFLLRNGVPYQTFADIAKRVYVDLATEKFDIPGRKQSKSRVSILTGLSRREVLRVKRLPAQDDLGALDRINRAARVITGWVRDRRFSDESGQPMDLPFDGENVCFLQLVKSYSGDAPVRAVLDELMRVGVVERTPEGRIRLLERGYIPRTGEIDKIGILGSDASDLISTIDNNICHPDAPFFQRKSQLRQPPFRSASRAEETGGGTIAGAAGTPGPVVERAGQGRKPPGPRDGPNAGRGRDLLFPRGLQRRKRTMSPMGKNRTAPDRSFIADVGFLHFFHLRGDRHRFGGRGSQRHRRQYGGHHQFRQRRDVRRALPDRQQHDKNVPRHGPFLRDGQGGVPGRDGCDRSPRAQR